jgi:hypothetical protein
MTGVELRLELKKRTRQIPTPNQLGNLLSKAPYFVTHGTKSHRSVGSGNSVVAVWEFDHESCLARGWLNDPIENRHLDDPYIPGVTTNRYRPNGVLVGGPKDWLAKKENDRNRELPEKDEKESNE